jgi:hypothetical protein
MKTWKDQRKFEEKQVSTQAKGRESIAKMAVDIRKKEKNDDLKSRQTVLKEKYKLEADRLKVEHDQSAEQLESDRATAVAERKIEDLRFNEWKKDIQDSGYAIDVAAVTQYVNNVKETRAREDFAYNETKTRLKEDQKEATLALKEKQEAELKTLDTEKERLALDLKTLDTNYSKGVRDNQQRVKDWTDERRQEEKDVDKEYADWKKKQSELQKDFASASL